MAFSLRYYYEFADLNGGDHKVEIHQDIASPPYPVPQKIKGGSEPFKTYLSTVESKLTPIRGTGADMEVLAETPLKFLNLYTANDQEYRVLHYIDSSLNWCGYLNAEIFTSPINRNRNYIVSLNANDGMAVLDTINYLDDDGEKFSGMSSQWDIIKFIVNKLNLPYNSLLVNISTIIADTSILTETTTFHHTYINNDNFYDEDDKPMTLREVLESTLQPYGAFIIQDKGNLIITDTPFIISGEPYYTFTLKSYDLSTFSYLGSVNYSPYIGELESLGFAGSGQNLEVLSGFNKEVISYSPYKHTELIDYEASYSDLPDKSDFDTSTNVIRRGATNYQWDEHFFENSKTWDKSNYGNFCFLKGVDGLNTKETDAYLKINNPGLTGHVFLSESGCDASTLSFTYKKDLPYVLSHNDYSLRIKMKSYARTVNDLNNDEDPPTQTILAAELGVRIRIGNKKYIRSGWVDISDSRDLFLMFQEKTGFLLNDWQNISDQWQELTDYKITFIGGEAVVKKIDYLIPLSGAGAGDLSLEIFHYVPYHDDGAIVEVLIEDFRIKDIEIKIVDKDGNEVDDSDVEYIGYMNKDFKNEGSQIKLTQGTNITNYPIERGGLYKLTLDGYVAIQNWVKSGVSDNIENLLLRSYIGNYETKTLQLTVETNTLPKNVGYVTYEDYFPNKRFMINGYSNSYKNMTSTLTLQEVFPDSLEINKSF